MGETYLKLFICTYHNHCVHLSADVGSTSSISIIYSCLRASIGRDDLRFCSLRSRIIYELQAKTEKIIVEFLRLLFFSQKSPSLMDVLHTYACTHVHMCASTYTQIHPKEYKAKGCVMTFLSGHYQFLSCWYTHAFLSCRGGVYASFPIL